ncbi:MAG TPA: patatin-like phospholipase family protein [Gemmataceae bacterium]|nr:patatin-like phospholipase family protein [Gemmataceae bacterium]
MPESPRKIVLTLSGGGFRATLFHLGVVRFLYEAKLLDRVKKICSVSGGSVLGAHLGLNWERYRNWDAQEPDSHYHDTLSREIIQFAQCVMRGRIGRRLVRRACLLAFWITVAILAFFYLYSPASSPFLGWLWSLPLPWPWTRWVAWLLPACLAGRVWWAYRHDQQLSDRLGWGAVVLTICFAAVALCWFSWEWCAWIAWVVAGFLWPLAWIARGRTQLLQEFYHRLYRNSALAALGADGDAAAFGPRPDFYILSTSLSSGSLLAFTKTGLVCIPGTFPPGQPPDANDLAVAKAVAASSAFPPFFPPVTLTRDELSWPALGAAQRMTDGGVYDNLGLHWLRYFALGIQEAQNAAQAARVAADADAANAAKAAEAARTEREFQAKNYDAVLESNAEAASPERPDEGYWWDLGRNLRASDIVMNRVSALESGSAEAALQKPVIACKLRDVVDDPTQYRIPSQRQRDLWAFRTDFDRFDDVEVYALAAHGYATARKAWKTAISDRHWDLTAEEEAPLNQLVWCPLNPHRAGEVAALLNGNTGRNNGGWGAWLRAKWRLLMRGKNLSDSPYVHWRVFVPAWQSLWSLVLLALTLGLVYWRLMPATQTNQFSYKIAPVMNYDDAVISANDWLHDTYSDWLAIIKDNENKKAFRIIKIAADPTDSTGAASLRRYHLGYDTNKYRFVGYAFCIRNSAVPVSDGHLPMTLDADGRSFERPADKAGRPLVVIGLLEDNKRDDLPDDLRNIIHLEEK